MEREPERRMGVREGGHGMMICGPPVTFNQDIDNSKGDSGTRHSLMQGYQRKVWVQYGIHEGKMTSCQTDSHKSRRSTQNQSQSPARRLRVLLNSSCVVNDSSPRVAIYDSDT
jgi:hypothetical protein